MPLSLIYKGAFDSEKVEVLPRTKYDTEIDETSNKPGQQAFEKSVCTLSDCSDMSG